MKNNGGTTSGGVAGGGGGATNTSTSKPRSQRAAVNNSNNNCNGCAGKIIKTNKNSNNSFEIVDNSNPHDRLSSGGNNVGNNKFVCTFHIQSTDAGSNQKMKRTLPSFNSPNPTSRGALQKKPLPTTSYSSSSNAKHLNAQMNKDANHNQNSW